MMESVPKLKMSLVANIPAQEGIVAFQSKPAINFANWLKRFGSLSSSQAARSLSNWLTIFLSLLIDNIYNTIRLYIIKALVIAKSMWALQ